MDSLGLFLRDGLLVQMRAVTGAWCFNPVHVNVGAAPGPQGKQHRLAPISNKNKQTDTYGENV